MGITTATVGSRRRACRVARISAGKIVRRLRGVARVQATVISLIAATSAVIHADIAATITANTLERSIPKIAPSVATATGITTAVAAATARRIARKSVRITSIAHSISIPLVYLRKLSYHNICARENEVQQKNGSLIKTAVFLF